MAERQLDDWIKHYMRYVENTESTTIFHKWTALYLISSVLMKKVWFNFGRIRIYPNLYIVLVATPGTARKTQAISFGEDILADVPNTFRSADAITPQALLVELEESKQTAIIPTGETIIHNSLSIISGEFESFLGQKKENTKMLVLLTDLFDCKVRPYKYRTKGSGTNNISSPFLTLLAATTPDSLASSLPSTAIGGGLTTRIIFLWAEKKQRKVAIPYESKEVKELRAVLIRDLSHIALITGDYNYTKNSEQWWINYYNNYEELDPTRICKDQAFNGWYSRKPMFILKVATILAASKNNKRKVQVIHFREAIKYLEEVESLMGNAFVAVGRSEYTPDVKAISDVIEEAGIISRAHLLQLTWRDVDMKKFPIVMDTLIKMGSVIETHQGPNNEKGVWFKWIGTK